jgi:hypothetical protein
MSDIAETSPAAQRPRGKLRRELRVCAGLRTRRAPVGTLRPA